MRFERLIAIRLVSHEAAALADFYVAALGFERGATRPIAAAELALLGLNGTGCRVALTMAGQALHIDQFNPPGRCYPEPRAADDRYFQHFAIVVADIAKAWERALAAGASPVSTGGPVQLPPANGSVQAVKFRDPEGHPLELLAFPALSVPLGINHSAVVVRNVATSIAFYQQRGLTIGTRTLNHGAPQAALDGLARARVDVVPLDPRGAGVHLELLGYDHPVPRDEMQVSSRDVAATRLVWEASTGTLITDPDGHLHQCQPRLG